MSQISEHAHALDSGGTLPETAEERTFVNRNAYDGQEEETMNNETKHTPGPWTSDEPRFCFNTQVWAEKSEEFAKRYPNDGRQHIATVSAAHPFELKANSKLDPSRELLAEAYANAALIAATPDFYAICNEPMRWPEGEPLFGLKDFASQLDVLVRQMRERNSLGNGAAKMLEEKAAGIRAVIAKAKGEAE